MPLFAEDRRRMVSRMYKSHSQRTIARLLGVSVMTVNRDIKAIKQEKARGGR